MKKIILPILALILLCSFANAQEVCNVGENCEWWAVITDSGVPVAGASANLTIYYSNSSILIENQNMTEIGTGIFFYNNTMNESGTYLGITTFYNSSGIIASSSQSKVLQEVDMDSNIIAIVFLIGVVLAFLAYYSKNVYTMSLASLWFVIAAVTSFRTKGDILGIPAEFQILFFIGFAGVLAVNAWFYYERTRQRRDSNED